ncbi:MAG: thrombospondin type 3 repeat-containing protein [Methylacidiphilales bacterium]|nr:thrombospondin type 3 repeat-containing protein [Candidatus Methylacidiphilales bacterium]
MKNVVAFFLVLLLVQITIIIVFTLNKGKGLMTISKQTDFAAHKSTALHNKPNLSRQEINPANNYELIGKFAEETVTPNFIDTQRAFLNKFKTNSENNQGFALVQPPINETLSHPSDESASRVLSNSAVNLNTPAVVDSDGDGIVNASDQCPSGLTNWSSNLQNDRNQNGCRDNTEDLDSDHDGVPDFLDNCPAVSQSNSVYGLLFIHSNQNDKNLNGIGDTCELNPPSLYIPEGKKSILKFQTSGDYDGDGVLNSVDCDIDNDGLIDAHCSEVTSYTGSGELRYYDNRKLAQTDRCPFSRVGFISSLSSDPLGIGCERSDQISDDDNDGVPNNQDNCPSVFNHDQADMEKDGIGNACSNITDSIKEHSTFKCMPDEISSSDGSASPQAKAIADNLLNSFPIITNNTSDIFVPSVQGGGPNTSVDWYSSDSRWLYFGRNDYYVSLTYSNDNKAAFVAFPPVTRKIKVCVYIKYDSACNDSSPGCGYEPIYRGVKEITIPAATRKLFTDLTVTPTTSKEYFKIMADDFSTNRLNSIIWGFWNNAQGFYGVPTSDLVSVNNGELKLTSNMLRSSKFASEQAVVNDMNRYIFKNGNEFRIISNLYFNIPFLNQIYTYSKNKSTVAGEDSPIWISREYLFTNFAFFDPERNIGKYNIIGTANPVHPVIGIEYHGIDIDVLPPTISGGSPKPKWGTGAIFGLNVDGTERWGAFNRDYFFNFPDSNIWRLGVEVELRFSTSVVSTNYRIRGNSNDPMQLFSSIKPGKSLCFGKDKSQTAFVDSCNSSIFSYLMSLGVNTSDFRNLKFPKLPESPHTLIIAKIFNRWEAFPSNSLTIDIVKGASIYRDFAVWLPVEDALTDESLQRVHTPDGFFHTNNLMRLYKKHRLQQVKVPKSWRCPDGFDSTYYSC